MKIVRFNNKTKIFHIRYYKFICALHVEMDVLFLSLTGTRTPGRRNVNEPQITADWTECCEKQEGGGG